jgi:signal transduction histidine kinase/CheY-like chemotaxis protein
LLVLVVVATLPALAVLLSFQRELRNDRQADLTNIASTRAAFAAASLSEIIESGRQSLSVLIGQQPAHEDCQAQLDHLRAAIPNYVLLALLRADGGLVCSSTAQPVAAESLARLLLPGVRGRFAALPGPAGPIRTLLMALPPSPAAAGRTAIAGLDLDWLSHWLNRLRVSQGSMIVITDRDGTILAMAPPQPSLIGHSRVPILAQAIGAPATAAMGLQVQVALSLDDLSRSINRASVRAYLLIGLGAAVSVLLALLVGQRYVRTPAAILLQTARRWGNGELGARARMPMGAASEFSLLGNAFNEMAELHEKQRTELQSLNDALELRVAERTRALLESNNRLQVEIAERELTEADLRRAQKLQAIGQLAGGIAHEFNNLLTAVLGSLELLRKWMVDPDDRQRRMLDTATQSVNRGARLTAQLLAFARKHPVLAVPVDVAELIQSMQGLLSATLGPQVQIESRLDPGLWPAMLDPNQFEAAILNLALNARDAMPRGGRLTITGSNAAQTPSDLPEGKFVCVVVADSGSGMPSEVAARAFEPFFTTKPPGLGAGLGLSQVHGMAHQSGGTVTIESRLGSGTRVILWLPRSSADPAELHAAALAATVPALSRDQAVLLVDDDEHVREVTATMLRENGYTVVTASGGADALDALEREGERITMVIADYAMPGMTGRELLEIVRDRRGDVSLLLATGYADFPSLVSDMLPIDQIIRKPFRSTELLARIHLVHARQVA